jgi:hypothetical protein
MKIKKKTFLKRCKKLKVKMFIAEAHVNRSYNVYKNYLEFV